MQKLFSVTLLIIALTCSANGQTFSSSTEVLDLTSSELTTGKPSLKDAILITTDDMSFERALPNNAITPEDSLQIQYEQVQLSNQRLRLDPEIVQEYLPQLIVLDEEKNPHVDYTSLSVYLLIRLYKQEKELEQLKQQLSNQ